jgi:hypothetical protein
MTRLLSAICLLSCVTFVPQASAAPISFVCEASGSGSLDGEPFSTREFVITAIGDTNNRLSRGDFPSIEYVIPHLISQIAINGLGTFQLLADTDFNADYYVEFNGELFNRDLIINGPIVNYSWGMLTGIGPISGTAVVAQWIIPPDPGVETTGGLLIFNYGSTTATFTAIVPEPCGASLMVIGVGVMLLSKRHWS